jgi:hypothetical protein
MEASVDITDTAQPNMMEVVGGASRHIETNQFVTPEGTVITTTTTTTDRLKDLNMQTNYNGIKFECIGIVCFIQIAYVDFLHLLPM